jgi:hypothetical protein
VRVEIDKPRRHQLAGRRRGPMHRSGFPPLAQQGMVPSP